MITKMDAYIYLTPKLNIVYKKWWKRSLQIYLNITGLKKHEHNILLRLLKNNKYFTLSLYNFKLLSFPD